MNSKLYFLVVSFLLVSANVSASSIGTVPGFLEFGEVEEGETISQEIYITSTFDSELTLNPELTSGAGNAFEEDEPARFETSEESIESWTSIDQNVIVSQNNSETITLEDGTNVVAEGKFTVEIDIPSDAEPGYHYGTIRLNPEFSSEEGVTGTRNWGEAVPYIRFKVKGNADRQVSVQDIRAFRRDQSIADIEVLLRNTGSVTVSTNYGDLDILSTNKENEGDFNIEGVTLEPGESQWVSGAWSENSKIEQGTFQVNGRVDYITGNAVASGSFSLPGINQVEVRPEEDSSDTSEEKDSVPIWFVTIVLVILGVLMWGFEIEPFWIVVVLGVLGISAFILLSGLPNFLLLILIVVVGIVIYGGL